MVLGRRFFVQLRRNFVANYAGSTSFAEDRQKSIERVIENSLKTCIPSNIHKKCRRPKHVFDKKGFHNFTTLLDNTFPTPTPTLQTLLKKICFLAGQALATQLDVTQPNTRHTPLSPQFQCCLTHTFFAPIPHSMKGGW